MAIVNINTLQDKISNSEYLTTYTDIYLKQSLANLGQRLSVKGDGITSNSFPVSDVFNEYLGEFDSSQIVKISYNYTDETINMYLCTYADGDDNVRILKNIGSQVPIDYVDNIVDMKEDFRVNSANSTINGVDRYEAGSLIIKSDKYYITSAVGLEASSSNDVNSTEYNAHKYVCDKISTDGILLEGLRILKGNEYVDKPSDKQELVMMHLWFNDVSDSNKRGYVLDIYKATHTDIEGYDTLESYIANVIRPITESTNRTFITPSYIKNALAPSSTNSADFFGWTLSVRYCEGNIIDTNINTIPNSLTYNNSDNLYWKVSDQFNTIWLDECKQYLNINDIVNYFAADTTTWFDTIKEKYNEALYISNNVSDTNISLKKQIFGSLIKKLFNDWIEQESTITENQNVYNIYMPSDYTIFYNCNDNDSSVIYNSIKNLTVKFEGNVFDKLPRIMGDNHEQSIIADSSENKVSVYAFTITYINNDVKSNIIDNIEFVCQYVLPYVNDDGYWCINDEKTDIFALGSDAGNPNIILTYSNNSTYSIISGIDKDILQSWSWDQHPVRIDSLNRDNNLGDGFYYEMNAYMPSHEVINNLNPNQFALISNALIVNFLSPDCETYPSIYNSTYSFDKSKIKYYDFTYDSSSAKFIRYNKVQYNDDLIGRLDDVSGGLEVPKDFTIKTEPHVVTTESGDGLMSKLYPSSTYATAYYLPVEGWNFAYKYTYECAMYQRNWLRNRRYDYGWSDEHRDDYLYDPTNAGTYIDADGNRQYYYDKVLYKAQLTYSYWYPLLYKADYSNAYTSYNIINKDSLLYKLGPTGVVPTIWTLEKNVEENAYQWTYIKKPNSPFALDANYINNLDNNIKYYLNNEYQPSNYEHKWIIFEKLNTLLKNNTIDKDSFIYPVVQNKDRDDFISIFGEPKDDNVGNETSNEIYNNDLNFEIAFYDTIEKNNVGYVSAIKQSDKRLWKGSAYDFHRLDVVSDDDSYSGSYGQLIFYNNRTLAYSDYNNVHAPVNSYTGVDGVIHYSLYPNEWIPNGKYDPNDASASYQYPTVELKEVLLRDVNTINRVNVLSFDGHEQNGNSSYMIYNAYFGTSYETANKNVLVIGTSYRNINLGTETMTTYESTYHFGTHNELDINVDNIELNGYANANKDFIANRAIWKKTSTYIPWTGTNIDVFSTVVQPVDIAYYMGVNPDNIVVTYNAYYKTANGTYTVYNSHIGKDNNLAALSYNNYLLSYLNRTKNTQTRYFNSRYMSNAYINGNPNADISYVQTLSYMNITQLLSKYCSIEIDDGSYIYGDAQHLFSLDTSDRTKDSYNNETFDLYASRYAQNRANRTYYMLLTTDLASDENLLFAYNTPKYNIVDGEISYIKKKDKDGNDILDIYGNPEYECNTYRFVATNPIAVTYTNNSYAIEMDYNEERYVYSFTYATSYYMEYRCPGCSLCSSNSCKFIQNCKWSEIVGYFNTATCFAPVDRKKLSYQYIKNVDGTNKILNGRDYIEQLYDENVAYWWFDENGNRTGSLTYFKDAYSLNYTTHLNNKNKSKYSTYSIDKISYTCWSDDPEDVRMSDMSKAGILVKYGIANYNQSNATYYPQVKFTQVGTNGIGNPVYLAHLYSGIASKSLVDIYEEELFTYNGTLNSSKNKVYDKTIKPDPEQGTGTSYTVCNAYYCHIPVTYYDPIRNLKDTYRLIKDQYIPIDYKNIYGTYLWMNVPDTYLFTNASGKPETIYYSTEERDLTYVGTYAYTPNLFVAKFESTINPINNDTPGKRGWDSTKMTNIYGEYITGSNYNELYDENGDGKIDSEDYDIYNKKLISKFEGYNEAGLEAIKDIIDKNEKETTYTCYFTYLGQFINTTYAYLSYKCINVRELTTQHSAPYFANGDLLSTNMKYNAIVDQHTYDWNFDNNGRINVPVNKDYTNKSYSYPVHYNDINNNEVTGRTIVSVNIDHKNISVADNADINPNIL
ncbi:MAG: hypothetical protein J6D03_01065 [Clostridia bacterium]|nr:hypothetical protein [Clostridia bacterium]